MTFFKNALLVFAFISLLGCSSDSDDSDDASSNVSGIIKLTGEETSLFGTTLNVGQILEGAEQTGTSESVTLLHANVIVENGDILSSGDPNNTFVVVVADFNVQSISTKTVSMAIVSDGVEYTFACATPGVGSFTQCGDGLIVDINGKKVTFSNTTVINTDTDKILTLNGTITW